MLRSPATRRHVVGPTSMREEESMTCLASALSLGFARSDGGPSCMLPSVREVGGSAVLWHPSGKKLATSEPQKASLTQFMRSL